MFVTLKRFIFAPLLDFFPSSCFGWRRGVLRLMGVKIANTVRVNTGFRVYGSGPCVIKDGVWIGKNCHFYTAGSYGVTIESNCEIGPECACNCQSHEIGSALKRAGNCILHDITICGGSWLGMRVTVFCNKIGSGAVVGAGSVVLHDVLDNTLVAGIPAKQKKVLS